MLTTAGSSAAWLARLLNAKPNPRVAARIFGVRVALIFKGLLLK
jgi:hypothetical protein